MPTFGVSFVSVSPLFLIYISVSLSLSLFVQKSVSLCERMNPTNQIKLILKKTRLAQKTIRHGESL